MEYGDPDGYGIYGQLTTSNDGGLICHECGQERAALGRHVRVHGLTAATYRERHGLGRSVPLASKDLRGRLKEKASARVGSPAWDRFEAARDTNAARQESLRVWREEPPRPQVRHARAAKAVAVSRSRKPRWCDVDGCGRKHVADGLCRTHYERRKRKGDVQADIPVRARKGGPQRS
jgi:hypothetical protein